MAAEGMDRPVFAPTLPGDALPRQRHRLIFSHDRGSGGRVAPVTSPGPCPGLRYCGEGAASGSRGLSTASGTASELTNPNDVDSGGVAPLQGQRARTGIHARHR
jgi:hypothetical protein